MYACCGWYDLCLNLSIERKTLRDCELLIWAKSSCLSSYYPTKLSAAELIKSKWFKSIFYNSKATVPFSSIPFFTKWIVWFAFFTLLLCFVLWAKLIWLFKSFCKWVKLYLSLWVLCRAAKSSPIKLKPSTRCEQVKCSAMCSTHHLSLWWMLFLSVWLDFSLKKQNKYNWIGHDKTKFLKHSIRWRRWIALFPQQNK